jgi:hypothetical protein
MSVAIDRLVRSRRKSIAIFVRPDGTVEVRAPLEIPEASIRAFVEKHADWVRKHQKRAQKYAPPPPKRYEEREKFLFLGREYPLQIVPRQRTALTFDGQAFRLARSALPRAEEAFTRWYKAQAALVLSLRLSVLAKQHGFKYEKVRITSARTRWGSCSAKGTLSFTWRLVMAPPEVVDYVIVHELAHTKVANHSKEFWALVETIMPGHKAYRAWLRKNGKFLTLK